MKDETRDRLGAPDLKLAGLHIWVHGRQFPDMHDHWDGNWLRVTVHCGSHGASVSATGSIIHLSELDGWRSESEALYKTLEGEANLECIEPELSVHLKSTTHGRIMMEVSLTPDHLNQRHWFQFAIDQSYLEGLIRDCESILKRYPIRGHAVG